MASYRLPFAVLFRQRLRYTLRQIVLFIGLAWLVVALTVGAFNSPAVGLALLVSFLFALPIGFVAFLLFRLARFIFAD